MNNGAGTYRRLVWRGKSPRLTSTAFSSHGSAWCLGHRLVDAGLETNIGHDGTGAYVDNVFRSRLANRRRVPWVAPSPRMEAALIALGGGHLSTLVPTGPARYGLHALEWPIDLTLLAPTHARGGNARRSPPHFMARPRLSPPP